MSQPGSPVVLAPGPSDELKRMGRKLGYAIAIGLNLVGLIIVNNILDWGWPAFITGDFAEVVPWLNIAMTTGIVLNILYMARDDRLMKSGGQVVSNLLSLYVTYRVLTVYPFDFGAYEFNWDLIAHFVLILALIGSGIGVITEAVKLTSAVSTDRD